MLIRPFTVLILLFITLSSCVTIYFDKPQPVDAKNLRKAPRALQGTWVMDLDTVTINSQSFYWCEWFTDTVSSTEVDTNKDIELRDGFIYDMSEEVPAAYRYTLHGSDYVVFIPDRISYELSDSALLRKISSKLFTFSLTQDGDWWEVFLVEKAGKRNLLIWYPARTDVCLMEAVGAEAEQYLLEGDDPSTAITNDYQKFWSVSLTKKKLLECYDLGAFGELLLELDARSKR